MRNYKMELLSVAIQLGWNGGRAQPVLIVGVPGTAKTTTIEKLGEYFTSVLREKDRLNADEQFEVFTVVMPQTAPNTIEGVSVPNEDRTEVNRLPLGPFRKLLNAKYGMIFGDELSSAQDETGAAFMALAQDGRAGDVRITNKISRVFAMNPEWCGANVRPISIPESNRFLWIQDWTVPVEDYRDYLTGGKGLLQHVRILDDNWEEVWGQSTRNTLAMFLQFRPNMKNQLEKQQGVEQGTTQVSDGPETPDPGPLATERSWENAMRLLAAVQSLGELPNSELAYLVLEGTVGEAAKEAWFEWLRTADFPNVDDMLNDPKKAQEWLNAPNQRSDKRKYQLEQVAIAGRRKDGFDIGERNKRWMAAWDVIGPTLENRRDDALGAARILAQGIPSKEVMDNPWFIMAQELSKSGISIDAYKLRKM